MNKHIRGNAWLLVLTVALACVIYPSLVWMYANVVWPDEAQGSMIQQKGPDGNEVVIGSRQIAQPFTAEHYFKPRPSAAGYNATASGASNFGASNPKLRDRVARQLGTTVVYNEAAGAASVQKDIEAWYTGYTPSDPKGPPLIVAWANQYPTSAAAWVKGDDNKAAVIEWLRGHPAILEDWKKTHSADPDVDLDDDKTIPFDDIVTPFFESIASAPGYAQRWPEPEEFDTASKDDKGQPVKGKRFKPVGEGKDLQASMFDMWLQDPANATKVAQLKPVPADMVMSSGSGLDPHITMRNAQYQLDGVAGARAAALKKAPSEVRTQVQSILRKNAFTPLGGLVGEPLVNVLEVNQELDRLLPVPKTP